MSIGTRIREERERLGLSQTKFAALAGASRRVQAKWEADETSPTAVALAEFANAGVDVPYVLTGIRNAQRLDNASRILATISARVNSEGEFIKATDEYVTGAFLAGKNAEEIKAFISLLEIFGMPITTLTRGRALAIIDGHGVKAEDMIHFMQSFALDVTMELAAKRGS